MRRAPQDSLFARLLGDGARAWCEAPGWKADELAAALDELERIQPSRATVSQDAGLRRVLARRCCIQIGPPGAGKRTGGRTRSCASVGRRTTSASL